MSAGTTPGPLRDLKDALFQTCVSADPGELFQYEALSEILGRNARGSSGRSLILSVGKRLEREAKRALICVPRVGYRIAQAAEHLRLGEKRHQRGSRQVNAAVRVLTATPMQELTPEEYRRHEAFLTILRENQDALRHIQRKARTVYAEIDRDIELELQEGYARLQALSAAPAAPKEDCKYAGCHA